MTEGGKPSDVTGIILAGGRSRRMGLDKAMFAVAGVPLIVSTIDRLKTVFETVLVIGHRRPGFDALHITPMKDLVPDCGVLGGLYTGLSLAGAAFIFAVACDMPYLDCGLIRKIISYRHGADAVIPAGPRGEEPLFAVYSRSCIVPFLRSIEAGNLKVTEALEGLEVRRPFITPPEDRPDPLSNLNSPEDLDNLT